MIMRASDLKIGKLYKPKYDVGYPNNWFTYGTFKGEPDSEEIRIKITKDSVLMYVGSIPKEHLSPLDLVEDNPQLYVFLLEDRFVKLAAVGVEFNVVGEINNEDVSTGEHIERTRFTNW